MIISTSLSTSGSVTICARKATARLNNSLTHSELISTTRPTRLHSTARTGPRLDRTDTLTYSLTMPRDSRGETKVSDCVILLLSLLCL